FHYDVMVTLILLFIFLAPRRIDFKDQPKASSGHGAIVVTSNGAQGLIYQVDASEVDAQDEDMVRVNFQRVLRSLAGPVSIERIEAVRDKTGHIVAYRAWVRK